MVWHTNRIIYTRNRILYGGRILYGARKITLDFRKGEIGPIHEYVASTAIWDVHVRRCPV